MTGSDSWSFYFCTYAESAVSTGSGCSIPPLANGFHHIVGSLKLLGDFWVFQSLVMESVDLFIKELLFGFLRQFPVNQIGRWDIQKQSHQAYLIEVCAVIRQHFLQLPQFGEPVAR